MSPSINGLGTGLPGLRQSEVERRPGAPLPDTDAGPGRAREEVVAGDYRGAPSPEALAGVDPRLWELLSAIERVFYVRNTLAGPLTYGPDADAGAPEAPGNRLGGRIDLRA